jgi:hypothetical protein
MSLPVIGVDSSDGRIRNDKNTDGDVQQIRNDHGARVTLRAQPIEITKNIDAKEIEKKIYFASARLLLRN